MCVCNILYNFFYREQSKKKNKTKQKIYGKYRDSRRRHLQQSTKHIQYRGSSRIDLCSVWGARTVKKPTVTSATKIGGKEEEGCNYDLLHTSLHRGHFHKGAILEHKIQVRQIIKHLKKAQ